MTAQNFSNVMLDASKQQPLSFARMRNWAVLIENLNNDWKVESRSVVALFGNGADRLAIEEGYDVRERGESILVNRIDSDIRTYFTISESCNCGREVTPNERERAKMLLLNALIRQHTGTLPRSVEVRVSRLIENHLPMNIQRGVRVKMVFHGRPNSEWETFVNIPSNPNTRSVVRYEDMGTEDLLKTVNMLRSLVESSPRLVA